MERRIAGVVRYCARPAWKYAPMSRQLRKQFDVLVVGGGPAGLAAAVCAAECGCQVGIVDDNPNLGGQIWRRETTNPTSEAANWAARLRVAGVEVLAGTRVFHQPEPGILRAETAEDLYELSYEKLVLATGAREGFLPFPGWTLPNVMGAGGLQALVKCGLPISGKRVVVAGSGPLLIAVAAYLHEHGAEIAMICEQASWTSLARFGAALVGQPQKIRQGFSLRKELSAVPFHANSWPVSAEGGEKLKAVNIQRGHKVESVSCDYLACGFHLLPNTELAALLGCQIQNEYGQEVVQVDDLQQTPVPGVYCAGEPTGIGGVELSLAEGQIAGFAAAGRSESAKELFHTCAKLNKFAKVLNHTFSPRAELKSLPHPETVVCRCEDVTYGRLQKHTSWRAAKLQTRCGMGPCQGRICGPATQFLFDWRPDSVRPPIFPTRFENLAVTANHSELEHVEVTGGK
jgi:NADPH-dependent 2,4-dienoyl-CoA reductase/sulfur reductase-like enzyme